jgi:hypothetical protein
MKKIMYLGLLCLLCLLMAGCRRGALVETDCPPVAKSCVVVCPDCGCECCECDDCECWGDCDVFEDDCHFVIPPKEEPYGSIGGAIPPYSIGGSSSGGGFAGGFSGGNFYGGGYGGGWGGGGGGGGNGHVPDHPKPPPPTAVPEPSSIIAWGSMIGAFAIYSVLKHRKKVWPRTKNLREY